VVVYNLRQAAKSHSEEGLNIALQCMRDAKADWSQRLRAIELIWAYGFGRPQMSLEVNTEHRFVVAPDQMPVDLWLERRGQPEGSGDAWLQAQKRAEGWLPAPATERLTSESPTSSQGHPTEAAPVLDLTAEEKAEDAIADGHGPHGAARAGNQAELRRSV
jgi:hypothetical protein